MSGPVTGPVSGPVTGPVSGPSEPLSVRTLIGPQWRSMLVVMVAMWGAGALLGLIWQWWSPPGPAGYIIGPGRIQADETEAFVAGDGRYALIVLVCGIAAGLLVWFGRPAVRGSGAVVALALGGLGGGWLTEVVGRLTGGGTDSGRADTVVAHLPLSVHMSGLLFVEAAAAVLVYGLCASFAVADDLGRPDPQREAVRGSVERQVQLQHAGGDGDGPGGPQQGDLPAQQYRGPG
ncbi:hypothetical protein M6B22_20210 [Jatrophihabitans cynanchi]|uniref:DUF2567 domain-containing protein n=1 Tax=Jatrophihabitans cynanchi TaxID=2944128 RepID=A0ABY7K128_9ACTN|nr:hypothetical protein [Jatrophihabitans sp. SB3-54]WAX56826.1 hypothetical protein M6B22_20210 [Jatrophihabitans sp. SB3-54]